MLLLALTVLIGCAPQPGTTPTDAGEAPPGAPTPATRSLGDADAVAAADMDGDGADEIVLVHRGTASWTVSGTQHTQDLTGPVQALTRGDIDGDGREEVLLGTGIGRGAPNAQQEIWALGAEGGRRLWSRNGPRNQITDLAVVGGRPWVVAFSTERRVEGGFLVDGTLDVSVSDDLATRMLPLGDRVAIGRLYGDEPKSAGDLRLRPANAGSDRTGDEVLETLRGVRALSSADLNGDGADELIVGDGWHHAYGAEGDPRLRLFVGPDWTDARTIGWLDGDYAVEAVSVVPGAGPDGPVRLLVTGSHSVRLLWRDPLGWAERTVSGIAETGNAVVVATPEGPAALVSGSPSTLIPL